MNFQSLRRTSVAYLIFLALCIPLAIALEVLFRSSVLALFSFFSRGISRRSSSGRPKASQQGRHGDWF